MKIYIDADACPKQIKEVLYKASFRLKVPLILVANKNLGFPYDELISSIIVENGLNVADDKIAELVEKNDLVITADIPLADRVIEKEAFALNPRGRLYTKENIKESLSTRNFFDELRKNGIETGGPKPFDKKDVYNFSNQLDTLLTKLLKKK
ncbi:MAG: YaiI/YqxD family protein [Candidatus Sericytochromatia bacterium]